MENSARVASLEYWVSGVGLSAACGSALLLPAGAISLIEKKILVLLSL
jgi:hypothetical protein